MRGDQASSWPPRRPSCCARRNTSSRFADAFKEESVARLPVLLTVLLAIAACAGGGQASPSPSPTVTPTAQPSPVGPGCPPPTDPDASPDPASLTGRWSADDGGRYYLHQVGDCLWWAGLSDEGSGSDFTNVAVGRVAGDRIELEWADVPRGRVLGGGTLSLRVEGSPPNRVTKEAETGTGFDATTWTRLSPAGPAGSPSPSPGGGQDASPTPSPAGPAGTPTSSPSPVAPSRPPSPSPTR